MNKYRNRLQIIADMLYAARNGAMKTQIMYKANLSYRLLGRYLHEVLEAGLVKSEKGNSYVLTAKGEKFLNRHIEYSELRRSLEKNLESVNSEKTILERLCGTASGFNKNMRSLNKNEELKRPM